MITYLTTGFLWMLSFDWLLRNSNPNGGFTFKQAVFNIIFWPLGVIFAIRGIMNDNDNE